MAHYLITVSWHQPYPKQFNTRTDGSNFAVAANKALRLWRKTEVPKKQIKEVAIKAVRV